MFNSRFIRGSDGSIVGWIDERNHGFHAYDAGGETDHTNDSSGQVVTITGDALASMIFRRKC